MATIRQRANLSLSSTSLTPDDISELIDLVPDRSDQRGSKSGNPVRPTAHSWVIDAADNLPVDEQVAQLLARVAPFADRLEALLTRPDIAGTIQLVREFDHADGQAEQLTEAGDLVKRPGQHQLLGFHLDTATIAQLARLGLELDVDEYG